MDSPALGGAFHRAYILPPTIYGCLGSMYFLETGVAQFKLLDDLHHMLAKPQKPPDLRYFPTPAPQVSSPWGFPLHNHTRRQTLVCRVRLPRRTAMFPFAATCIR